MKVLGISEMFPSREHPHQGTFVLAQCVAVSRHCEMRFLAPRFVPLTDPRGTWMERTRAAKQEERVGPVRVHRCSVPGLASYFTMLLQTVSSFLFMVPAALRLRARYRFDLVHAHGLLPAGLTAVAVGRLTGARVVVTSRGSDANVYPSHPTLRWLTRRVLRGADAVTTVSNALRERVLRLGADPDHTVFIPNGVDAERFRDVARPEDDGWKTVLFIGRLTPAKGVDDLLRAFAILSTRDPSVRLRLIGAGPLRAAARALGSRVEVVDPVPPDRIPAELARADLLCHPSRGEGWSNVCMEALASSVPVVASDIEGLREVVRHGETGLLAPAGDPVRLAGAMEEALARKWDRRAMADFVADHGWERIGTRYLEVYRKALA